MGRPSDEFWSLSYREIIACVEQYLDEREEWRMLFGTGIATQINLATKSGYSWMDIFPSRKKVEAARFRSLEETRASFNAAHSIVGTNK